MRRNCPHCNAYEDPALHMCEGKKAESETRQSMTDEAGSLAEQRWDRVQYLREISRDAHAKADAYARLDRHLRILAAEEARKRLG